MNARFRRLAALLLVGAVAPAPGACAGSGQSAPYASGPMPGGMSGDAPTRGYGPAMRRGYGRGMPAYRRWMGPGMRGGGMAAGPMLRHRHAMMSGIPSQYAELRSPLPATQHVIAAGADLYQANCASCHGSTGAGDGPAAAGLSPPPADLRWAVRRPMASDGYLMWAISDGGARLGTGMPAFAGALSERDRWRVIRYLRTL